MLVPKRAKYRKHFKAKTLSGKETRATSVGFGEYGLKSLGAGRISARQIEAARRAIAHYTKRGGRTWIRIFPDIPVTKKPAETGMGGGKGDVAEYVCIVRPGRILFEMGGVTRNIAEEALRLAAHKLPLKTKFVTRGAN